MAKNSFKIEGMKELQKSIKQLGEVPQKAVTPAARKGMNVALKSAKVNAPEGETGYLKKGIKLVGERSKHKGKKVYRIAFDSSMNDVFQKKNAAGKVTGYYPISQEYGFFARDGKYIPGFYFIHKSLSSNKSRIEKTIVDEVGKQIDKVLKG